MKTDPISIVRLPPESGIKAAKQIAELLKNALGEHDDVSIDIASIENADLTTVQLLLAARKQALITSKSVQLVSPPMGALRDVLISLGCTSGTGGPATSEHQFWNMATTAATGLAA